MGLLRKIQDRAKGKAISHRPDLAGRVHLFSSSNDGEGFPDMDSFVGWARVYESYVWVRKAIRFITDSVKFLPLMVVDDKTGEEQAGHYIPDLFGYVNDTETSVDLWSKWVVHKLLGGESPFEFVLNKRGEPVEVWARRPDKIIVVPDASPERKLYPRVAGYRNDEDRDHLITPDLMWFDKFVNPTNEWRGLSVISAVREGIAIDVFAHQAIKTFLKSGSRPDFVVVTPQGISTTERERVEAHFMSKFSGPDKVHRPFVSEEGITDIRPLSHPPKDIQWLEDSKFGRDEVAAIFNVPDLLMGFGTDSYDNSDKMNSHLLYYWTMTGTSLLNSRDVSLTKFFHQYYPRLLDKRHRITTDLSSVPVLREDYGNKLDQAVKLWQMGVPFEQINERLELGIDYASPVMVDSNEKSAELERFRRWAKKRNGKPLDVTQFQSDILTDDDKVKALGDAVAVMPPFQATDYPLARQAR